MEVIMYPLFALLAGVILTLITGKLLKSDISRAIGIASLIAAMVLLGVFYPFGDNRKIFGDLFILDEFGGFFVFLFLGLAMVTLIGTMRLLDNTHEMVALVLISAIGMAALSITNNLIMLFVSWEIMSLSTYVLTGLGRRKEGTESAMKFFIYGAVSSALVLFAFSLIYGMAGTMQIDQLGPALVSAFSSNPNALGVIALAATILVFGFGYKMGMVPFHLWLPDVYEGAPAPVAGYLAGVTKKVAVVAAAKIFLSAIINVDFAVGGTSGWMIIFAILAVVTMTVGNIAALAQKSVVRMFAYSSISQIGYILIGLTVLDEAGLAASMMQITMHAITTIGAFATIGVLFYKYNLKTFEDFKGLARTNPVIGTGLAILMLSLAGIPPFGGFFSKLFLFKAAVDGGLLWLAIVGVLNSVLSLGYYLPLIRNMFLEKGEDREKLNLADDIRLLGPVTVNIIAAISLMVLPFFVEPLINLLQAAVGVIF